MIYQDRHGNDFELPKFTIDLSEKFSEASKGLDKEALQRRYNLLCEILPEEYLNEALEGATFAEIDISELNLLFFDIKAAYEKPAMIEQLKQASEVMESIAPILEKMERIKANGGTKPSRQGFARIK